MRRRPAGAANVRCRERLGRASGAIAAALLTACSTSQRIAPDSSNAVPVAAVTTVRLAFGKELRENSAAATSVAHPGVIFSVNDSGNDPVLFAFDTTGADRGRWLLRGAKNRDWEAVAVARCDPGSDAWCVFVGDVGDNEGNREEAQIYRVAEPAPRGAGETAERSADVLRVRYADAPHNTESIYIAPDGGLILIAKESRRAQSGSTRPTLVFRVATPSWTEGATAEAVLADSLPIVPRSAPGRMVTDAALTPDGRALAVRTSWELLVFATDSTTGLPLSGRPPVTCDLRALREEQGEGVGFLEHRRRGVGRFVLTTEGRNEPLRLVDCPMPDR